MFNPKSNNLLDEQLAVSGLEMNWVSEALTGGSLLLGGIFGSSDRRKANRRAKKAEREQKKLAKKVARLTNEHNDKLDAADKANYYAMREYSHNTNMRNWQHGKVIQDYEYAFQDDAVYQKSTAIGNEQLGLNAEAMAYAIQDEQAAMKKLSSNSNSR